MGKHNLAQAEGDYPEWPWRFGYVGPDDRLEFMPCPSQVCGPVPNACPSWFKRRQQTYLVNYPSVWGFHLPQATVTTHTSFRNSAILEKVPSEVWLIADGATNYTSRSSSHSHNPNGSGSWALTVDVDFDGIPDSSTDVFHCGPPFQFLDPLHNKTFNMLFVDSSVRRVLVKDWALNKGGMWGVGLKDGGWKHRIGTSRMSRFMVQRFTA